MDDQRHPLATDPLAEKCIATIRTLSMDAVQKANSGHPGTAMATAPVVYTLWQHYLHYDPRDAHWPNRDRFLLSAGHACILHYAMLHLAQVQRGVPPDHGPAVSIDDLKQFRQLDSRCPGHPELGLTTGIETTTGPLGQGCGTSVGMAMAGQWLGAKFNRPGFSLYDYDVYVLCSDGDMMEGITSEAASLAGHLKLDNLCWIYDNNHITIEGSTDLAFSDDVAMRFSSYGWNVVKVGDANRLDKLHAAFGAFQDSADRPTLIIVDSHIGYGAPHKHDTSAAHGEPLGEDEVRLTKRAYGWPEDAHFLVPNEVYRHFSQGMGHRGEQFNAAWQLMLQQYRRDCPDLYSLYEQIEGRTAALPPDFAFPAFAADDKGLPTRTASGKVLNALAQALPTLLGGSADIAESTKVELTFDTAGDFSAGNFAGRKLHFGIREHAMAAAMNGLALAKLRPFGSTYLTFSDYLKPALRLSAIMEQPVIYVFSHDSIGLGEDGPTHQPIEQLAALRAVPGLVTLRPADANEVVECWRVIVGLRVEPVCLIVSRQSVPIIDRSKFASAAGVVRGAYVLSDADKPQVLLIGTGSEVSLCIAAQDALAKEGIRVRVVSMPSWELFLRQDDSYQRSVLPPELTARVAVEAGSPLGWHRFTGANGEVVAMHGFGASAPYKDLLRRFGFTADRVVEAAKRQIAKHASSKEARA